MLNTNQLPFAPNSESVYVPKVRSEDEGIKALEQIRNANEAGFRVHNVDTSISELQAASTDFLKSELPPQPASSRVWGINYHAVDMSQSLDYLEQVVAARIPTYAITANLNYAMLCAKHPRLAAFTERATLVLCDGMPALWRSRLNRVKLPERVTGSDLIYKLSERCAEKKLRVYLYGASEGIAEKAALRLQELYPNLIIAGVQCPPFHACSSEEIRIQLAKIKQARPDVLYVALGQPKGEYWIEDHLEELGVPLSIQLGASFDFVAGNVKRAPSLMQRAGLEWLYRTFRDPSRLAPRYAKNFTFLLSAIRAELLDSLSTDAVVKR